MVGSGRETGDGWRVPKGGSRARKKVGQKGRIEKKRRRKFGMQVRVDEAGRRKGRARVKVKVEVR